MAPKSVKTQTLKFKRAISAPPAEVFRAFTHPTALRDWFCNAAEIDPRVGGHFYAGWDSGYSATGAFTALEPGKKIAFTWHGRGEPEATRVQVSLAVKGDGTTVTLAHAGVGSGKKWAAAIEQFTGGWETSLENLQSVLETGVDLRIARLPRLGIFIDEFNADIAARLGVPVKAGLRLAGTAEGTGARAAGLEQDDVMVKLGGKKAVDFPSLTTALRGHQAGDKVPVVFYRGHEKKTVTMELSRRPIPELPPTAAALADLARQNYTALEADFAKRLEGVTEAEAERRPAANEWNLKELVAHFVACERDLQSWIAQMVNDREMGDSLEFRPNVTVRLQVLVARYPTLPALLEELKRSADETTALIAALPPEFVARKHVYQRLAQWTMFMVPSHLPDEHGAQVQATLEAARQPAAA